MVSLHSRLQPNSVPTLPIGLWTLDFLSFQAALWKTLDASAPSHLDLFRKAELLLRLTTAACLTCGRRQGEISICDLIPTT